MSLFLSKMSLFFLGEKVTHQVYLRQQAGKFKARDRCVWSLEPPNVGIDELSLTLRTNQKAYVMEDD